MATLSVAKNDQHLCTVGSTGLFMMSAGVWGDLWSKEAAHLDLTGGTEEENGKTEFLVWELLHELQKGDRLRFDFGPGDQSSRAPEVSPPDDTPITPFPNTNWPPSESEVAELERRPLVNDALAWRFSMNDQPPRVFEPQGGRQHLSFGLLWNNRHPERIRISLHCSSLREIVARQGGLDFITEYVPLGSRFELHIGA
jgi:hypothetical protein